MRILFDHQVYTKQKFGGISRYFNELKKITENEVEVDDCIPVEIPMKFDLYSKGIRYIKIKAGVKKKEIKEEAPVEMRDKILLDKFDIFHPTYYETYFLELTKKPFVLTVFDMIHEIYKEYFDLSDPTSERKRLLCKKASAIITISENTKRDLIDIFNIPAEKIHAIPLASDFDKVISGKPANAEGFEKYILYTGTRWGYKNFYFPVIALSEILKNDKSLLLVCTGHAFQDAELHFFKELGIAGQVKHIYLENDKELAWAYQNASLFIFPSLYEGFGFPLLEAFASNCPVMAARCGSLPEVGGNAVLYFDPKNMKEIKEAAHKILYDINLRNVLIENGKEQFKKYSWDRCRMQTAEVYKSVLKGV